MRILNQGFCSQLICFGVNTNEGEKRWRCFFKREKNPSNLFSHKTETIYKRNLFELFFASEVKRERSWEPSLLPPPPHTFKLTVFIVFWAAAHDFRGGYPTDSWKKPLLTFQPKSGFILCNCPPPFFLLPTRLVILRGSTCFVIDWVSGFFLTSIEILKYLLTNSRLLDTLLKLLTVLVMIHKTNPDLSLFFACISTAQF